MADGHPRPELELHRSDPELRLALFDVATRLTRILAALINGY